MAKFSLKNLNPREDYHYPKGSMELHRSTGNGNEHVWVVTPRDMAELAALLVAEIFED